MGDSRVSFNVTYIVSGKNGTRHIWRGGMWSCYCQWSLVSLLDSSRKFFAPYFVFNLPRSGPTTSIIFLSACLPVYLSISVFSMYNFISKETSKDRWSSEFEHGFLIITFLFLTQNHFPHIPRWMMFQEMEKIKWEHKKNPGHHASRMLHEKIAMRAEETSRLP